MKCEENCYMCSIQVLSYILCIFAMSNILLCVCGNYYTYIENGFIIKYCIITDDILVNSKFSQPFYLYMI